MYQPQTGGPFSPLAMVDYYQSLNAVNGGSSFDFGTTQAFARLFMMPFGVSSFSALIKGQGFVLIFPPTWAEFAVSAGACGVFLAVVAAVKAWAGRAPAGPQ